MFIAIDRDPCRVAQSTFIHVAARIIRPRIDMISLRITSRALAALSPAFVKIAFARIEIRRESLNLGNRRARFQRMLKHCGR